MNIIKKNYRNEYNNHYRHGVCIGNYVEDIIGEDLRQKQETHTTDPKHFLSEKMDQYQWPALKEIHIKDNGNKLTQNYNSNFDLNIDFTTKNVEDYLKLQNTNYFQLKDKNSFLPEQHKTEIEINKLQDTTNGSIMMKTDIFNETQKKLKSFHHNDARGLFNTVKSGLVENLYFGHGLDQKNFTKNEYASTYHLTMNEKEKTDKIFNTKYTVQKQFMKPAKETYDKSDWNFRNYRRYDEFTKFYDKKTNIEY